MLTTDGPFTESKEYLGGAAAVGRTGRRRELAIN